MKLTAIAILALTVLGSCSKNSTFSVKDNNGKKLIALLPLGNYHKDDLAFLQQEISTFFTRRVIILHSLQIPQKIIAADNSCNADSLLGLLSQYTNDTIAEVVGITSNDINQVIETHLIRESKLRLLTFNKSIFGLGYISGNACVISSFRIAYPDKTLMNNRLRKITLHEMGHNLGLMHCSNDSCLMSAKNGNMVMLNKTGGDFCTECRHLLN